MISILMPIYNGIEFINDSVSSALSQTCSQWELIIGINGHPPNSSVYHHAKYYEMVDPRIKVFELDTTGKSDSLNKMLSLCTYDWIAILDVDDIWMPDKLSIQMPYVLSEQYDVIGTKCIYFGERENIVPYVPTGDFTHKFNFAKSNPIINSSAIIKKNACYWKSVYEGVEDYDLWIRLQKEGRSFYNCEQILVKHRIHKASAFNSKGNHLVPKLLKSHFV